MVSALDERPLLTVQQLAAKLAVERKTIYSMMKRGEITAVRVGAAYRFLPEDVDEYLSHKADRNYKKWELRQP